MTDDRVRAAIVTELASRGYDFSDAADDLDLIGAGVNSAALIQTLSALEDVFEIDLDAERLFSGPVTVARLIAEITRSAALR